MDEQYIQNILGKFVTGDKYLYMLKQVLPFVCFNPDVPQNMIWFVRNQKSFYQLQDGVVSKSDKSYDHFVDEMLQMVGKSLTKCQKLSKEQLSFLEEAYYSRDTYPRFSNIYIKTFKKIAGHFSALCLETWTKLDIDMNVIPEPKTKNEKIKVI